MTSTKYIGMDVHKESISIAVRNSVGKVVMESVIETKASVILQFLNGLSGDLHVTFEEGTAAAWLYDLLKPHVARLVVCNPRRNGLLKVGNKSDRIDAQKLAELLRGNQLQPVYHGEHGLRTLKELVRSYLTVSKDLARVMTRVKALYRSWGIPCSGTQVYSRLYRVTWLSKITEPGVRLRAAFYFQQLDALRTLRQEVRQELLAESHKHSAWKRLCGIPSDRPDPRGGGAWRSADTAPFSHQAAVVEYQWFCDRDAQQRRSPPCQRPTAKGEEASVHSRPEPKPQSRSEESV